MEAQKSRGKYWGMFLFWTAVMGYFLVDGNLRPFFWLWLPFVCTNFVKGMDII